MKKILSLQKLSIDVTTSLEDPGMSSISLLLCDDL